MIKNSIVIIVLIGMLSVLVAGCGNSPPAILVSPPDPSVTAPQSTPSSVTPSPVPPTQTIVPVLKTEVIYFHLTQRCVTCLCFESRVKFVIDTYYKDAISSGKMAFSILNAQDKKNEDMSRKYKAVGSQLFVNTISNGVDHIRDIQQIWDWNCNNDPEGFNRKVKDIIDQSLKGQF